MITPQTQSQLLPLASVLNLRNHDLLQNWGKKLLLQTTRKVTWKFLM